MSSYGDPDLIREVLEMRGRLDRALIELKKAGVELAQKERDYKVALASKTLELRQQNTPVGLIDKLVHGMVADERFERDVAKAMHETAYEGIMVLKLNIKLLDNQIAREWGANG